jgi:hypothetical protein
MASKARDLSNFISTAAIDASEIGTGAITTDKIADTTITHAKLHTTMDLSGKTVTLPTINALDVTNNINVGGTVDGVDIQTLNTTAGDALPKAGGTMTGVIAGFESTGIDDNATSTAITIDASENVGIGTSSPASSVGSCVDATGPLLVGGHINSHQTNKSVIENNSNNMKLRAYGATSGTGYMTFHTGGGGDAADSEAMRINADGIVTKPLQPAFQARTGSVANLPINQNYTVPYGTEVFDQNADYNPATYTFTAPVTGKYQLNASIYLNNVVVASGYVEIFIATSNRIYYSILSVNGFDTDLLYFTMPHTVLADMDAGDTAVVGLWIASGSQTADLHGQSYFSGYLVC